MNRRRIGRYLLERYYDYKPSPFNPDEIRSAVIFVPKAIGDGMATFPVLRALQKRGTARIGIVASTRNVDVFEALKSEGVYVMVVPHDRDYRAVRRAARDLNNQWGKIDLCIDGTAMAVASSPSIYFTGTLRARMNLQLSNSTMKLFAPLCAEPSRLYASKSAPKSWASLMRTAGIADVPGKFELPIPQPVEQQMLPWIKQHVNYIALNLDGSVAERTISEHKARELISELHRLTGLKVVIPFSPAGRAKAAKLAAEFSHVSLYPESSSILHSATIIKHASLVISPDTAAIHIASAYDRPTLALYGKTDPVWLPQSTIQQVNFIQCPLPSASIADYLAGFEALFSQCHATSHGNNHP